MVIVFTDVTPNFNLQQQLIDNKERLELQSLADSLEHGIGILEAEKSFTMTGGFQN